MRERSARAYVVGVWPEELLAGCDVPLRWRALAAAVPVVFAALVFGLDPRPSVGAAAAVVAVPALAGLAGVGVPLWLCTASELGGVAWLMTAWPRCDLSLIVLVYAAGKMAMLRGLPMSLGHLVLCLGVPIGWQIGDGYPRAAGWLIGMTFAWACGVVLRKQQETMVRLHGAQLELAEQAAAQERRRIAREVHDLVAHSLAVTMLHLTGARLALADGEADEARSALEAAETLGRSSLAGIRRAVGLLADPAAGVSWSPEPDERDVVSLVEDYRHAGVDIDLVTDGEVVGCEAAVGLAVYRVVQESLANAVRHAPGRPVRVRMTWGDGMVAVTVVNPVERTGGVPTPTGHGLVGMRERVEALEGTFDVAVIAAEWRVSALLPTDARVQPEIA